MNRENGLPNYKKYILLAALVGGLTYGIEAPAFADSNWLLERLVITAPSSHEISRGERALAVEKARIAFEYAKAISSEKAAPYEYYLAEGYLKLATKELREGDKIGVVHFAAKSERYSRMAGEKAKGESE